MTCFAEVVGTKGTMKLPEKFWSGTKLVLPNGDVFESELETAGAKLPCYNYPNSAGLALEAQHVRECLLQGWTESPKFTLQMTLNAAHILQEVRTQVGVKYPQD